MFFPKKKVSLIYLNSPIFKVSKFILFNYLLFFIFFFITYSININGTYLNKLKDKKHSPIRLECLLGYNFQLHVAGPYSYFFDGIYRFTVTKEHASNNLETLVNTT